MTVKYSMELKPKRHLPLTPEQIAAIEARAPRDEDIVYDEDCPPMTDEQLRQFRRIGPNWRPGHHEYRD